MRDEFPIVKKHGDAWRFGYGSKESLYICL
jgi:hypothetical protein